MGSSSSKAVAAFAFGFSQLALSASISTSMVTREGRAAIPIGDENMYYYFWDSGEIPYILQSLPHDLSDAVRGAMREWEQSTCIRFLPKTNQDAWVNFKKFDKGCYARALGAPFEGETIVNLDYPNAWEKIASLGMDKACLEAGTPVHELGHIIGLAHEHQRADRDQYVRILWDRIQNKTLDQFVQLNNTDVHLPFDYNSVMIYDTKAFAKNNWRTPIAGQATLKHTIETVTGQEIHPWNSPTPNDFKAVNDAYKCEEYYTRVIPECLRGTIPQNRDFSSYSFILDKHTEAYMRGNGYTHIGVHQNCRSNRLDQDTDNWAFTPLNGWGPRAPYKVTTNRCKKDFDRHASRYEISLCRGTYEDACDMKCGLRRVCPFDANEQQVDSKAIDVVDDNLWICHPH